MLDAFGAFLKNSANRNAVRWIGGIVVVASGLWAVIKFHSKKKNCWTWIEIGDLWMVRGSLAEADKAFRSALKAAEDSDERGLAVAYNRIGDVLVAQGTLPEALKSYRHSLAIVDRLAKVDPGNAGWQRDLAGLKAFSNRPVTPPTTGADGVSRFSRMEFPCMLEVSDCAESAGCSRLRIRQYCLPPC
jgi:tetratricopeptide (TPR) repeat protein